MMKVQHGELCCETFKKWLDDKNFPLKFKKSKGKKDWFGNSFILSWRTNNKPFGFVTVYFCSWCGKELDQAFICSLRDELDVNGVKRAYCDGFDFEKEIPEHLLYLKNRDWYEKKLEKERSDHARNGCCEAMEYALDEGHPYVYVQNIRTYGILKKRNFEDGYWLNNKAEYCDWESINYCDACGAKFPERLDEKLTEILQKEHGLSSWRDYKKAPHEFRTDEWWKKRGL